MSNEFKVEQALKELTKKVLKHTSGNRTEAARLMGISVRTLRNWINKYDLGEEFPPQTNEAKSR